MEQISPIRSSTVNSDGPQKPYDVTLVYEIREAKNIVKRLLDEEAIGLDIETTGLDPLLDKIRLVQISTTHNTYVIDINHVPVNVLQPLLVGGPIKVIHNGKFDASFLYEADGGRSRTHLRHHDHRPGVTSQRLCKKSQSNNKRVFKYRTGQGGNKPQTGAPERLSGHSLNTLHRTQLFCYLSEKYWTKKAANLQITEVVKLENRLVPAICWMERAGVNLDKELWDELVKTAGEKALQLKNALNSSVAEHTMSGFDLFGNAAVSVNWDSPAQVKKLLSDLGVQIENTRHLP
ncbi:MAG: hypothetical protein CM1200mP3_06370 [Chloroflexota bacterium]|nr:MAG: hypothetical protein CM1200mP3_06370 [Chloroflexota bacterium]